MKTRMTLPAFAVTSAFALLTSGVLAELSPRNQRPAAHAERMQRHSGPGPSRTNSATNDEPDRVYDIASGNFIDNPDKHPGDIEH